MINWKSILSSFDDIPTLLEWLKLVEKALKESVLTSVTAEQDADKANTKFIFNFADGTKIETAYIQTKGDTGATGAKIIKTELIGQDANGGNIYKQTFDDGTTATFTAPKGAKGDKGADGVSITGIDTVSDEVIGDETHTTLRAHYSNNTTDEFVVTAKNGKDSGAKIYLHMFTLKAPGRTKKFNFNLFSLRGTAYAINEIIDLLNKATLSDTNTICGTYITSNGYQFAALCGATYDASANTSQFKIFTSDGAVDFINASSVDVVTEL